MKIWPFDPYAEHRHGTDITPSELRTALRPLAQIREAVGDEMDRARLPGHRLVRSSGYE